MPTIEKLAGEFDGRARVVKVELDREGEVLSSFDASWIPVYVLFRDGVEVDRASGVVGALLERRVRSMIDRALAP